MGWISMGTYVGHVGYNIYMMMCVDDLRWFMLVLGLDDDIMKYRLYNHDIYARFMIFDEYNMKNMWISWWTPTVHV